MADLAGVWQCAACASPATGVRVTGGERITRDQSAPAAADPWCADLGVALNMSRSIATLTDANINRLITMQIALGAGGLLASLLLAWALVAAHAAGLRTSAAS